ncbi:MAG: malonic semialdehyde reductase [Candidatus Sulfotelmatobacter sp.]|jgi:3-hydroxypropanoate dehydrogenase
MPDAPENNSTSHKTPVSNHCIDQIFREARTHNVWLPQPVSPELLRQVFELSVLGPTSANTTPARYVFVTTAQAKERLRPALSAGNVDKTMSAPVTVIIAWDTEFHEMLPKLFPNNKDMRSIFAGKPDLIEATAFRNSSLEGAYFILAARALGLDCGPMSGFDAAKVNAEFFPDGKWKTNFLCNLGYGDSTKLFPRNPRLSFDEACLVL